MAKASITTIRSYLLLARCSNSTANFRTFEALSFSFSFSGKCFATKPCAIFLMSSMSQKQLVSTGTNLEIHLLLHLLVFTASATIASTASSGVHPQPWQKCTKTTPLTPPSRCQ